MGKITKQQLSDSLLQYINSIKGSSIQFRKNTVTVEEATNKVAIGISDYNKDSDLLMVYKNTVYLEDNIMYTVSSDNAYINNPNGTWDANSLFNFIVIKITASSGTGGGTSSSYIPDGSITESKLDSEFIQKINSFSSQLDIKKKNTILYNKFLYKLRKTTSDITICCEGDSMTYGTDTTSSDKRAADTTLTDNGSKHTATRASISYPEALEIELNEIYDNNITVINHGYSGDGTKKGYEHWNASGCDLCIINYGINDAINSNISYMGDVEEFIKWYRLLIERELENGTAVILVSPPKQLVVSTSGKDSRVAVDVFSNAVFMLGEEYQCPVIDGNLIMEGYSSDFYSDTTHHNGNGYKAYACNFVGILIGEGANRPYKINGYDMLGGNILLDNFVLSNGALIANSSSYPSPSECNGTAPAIFIKDGQSVTYSFYCEQPNIVVVPSLYTKSENCNIIMELDRGIEQPKPQNLFYNYNQNVIDKSVIEPSKITVTNENLVEYGKHVYTLKNLKNSKDPHIKIMKRGWHTITVSTNFGNTTDSCTLYGIEFITYNDYLNKVIDEIEIELYNCVPFDEDRTPKLINKNGTISIIGGIKDITNIEERIMSFPQQYAPKINTTHIVAISASSNSNGYAILTITPNGNVFLNYKSMEASTITTLYGCSWNL